MISRACIPLIVAIAALVPVAASADTRSSGQTISAAEVSSQARTKVLSKSELRKIKTAQCERRAAAQKFGWRFLKRRAFIRDCITGKV
jgi:hypothetical protein